MTAARTPNPRFTLLVHATHRETSRLARNHWRRFALNVTKSRTQALRITDELLASLSPGEEITITYRTYPPEQTIVVNRRRSNMIYAIIEQAEVEFDPAPDTPTDESEIADAVESALARDPRFMVLGHPRVRIVSEGE